MSELKIIGHAGAGGLAPPNTIASLKKALEHKVDQIELDVRVTKDNISILNHDPVLTDASGNKLKIKEYTYSELLDHKSDLTTFEEAILTVNKKVPLYVEVKPGVAVEPVTKVLKKLLAKNFKSQDFTLWSFSQDVLLELHRQLPNIKNGVIERWSGLRAIHRAKQLDTRHIAMDQHVLWFGFISSMAHRGYELYTYTLNDPKKARRWAKYGLAGVVTDFPNRFIKR